MATQAVDKQGKGGVEATAAAARPWHPVVPSRPRDCHLAGTPSSSPLKRLPRGMGVQQNYSLADR